MTKVNIQVKDGNKKNPIQQVTNSDEYLINKMNEKLNGVKVVPVENKQPRDANGRFMGTRLRPQDTNPTIPDVKPNSVAAHFNEICDGLKDLYARKNKDYGNAWQKHLYKYGLRPFTMRVSEKIDRIDSIIDNGGAQVKDESILDTMLDIAAYAIMTAAEIKADSDKKILGKLS